MVELERVGGTGLRICNLRLGNVVVYKYQKTTLYGRETKLFTLFYLQLVLHRYMDTLTVVYVHLPAHNF